MKQKTPKVIFYRDELNEEFSTAQISAKTIDGNYVYDHDSFFGRLAHFFWYRLIAIPIAYCYLKLKFHHKIVGRKCLKPYRDKGMFLYGNHTQPLGDAATPTFISYPRAAYLIVHPNNVSIPFVGRVTPYLGAIPLPDDREAGRNFSKSIEKKICAKKPVFIYPEAHIWPYYTGIRPFRDDSFYYPIKYDVPAFCFTNTYQKRKLSSKPKIVTYVDGPFFADSSLSLRERRKDLRDRIYACMCERSKTSEVVMIEYKPCEEGTDHD